jgi:hypothetical protein
VVRDLIVRLVQVAEYALLHTATFLSSQVFKLPPESRKTLAIPQGEGVALDLSLSFHIGKLSAGAGSFGVALRAPPSSTKGAGLVLTFDVGAADAAGTRAVICNTGSVVTSPLPKIRVLDGETLDLRVLLDRPILEVVLQGGRVGFIHAQLGLNASSEAVHVFNEGKAQIDVVNVTAYGMGCGWTDTLPVPRHGDDASDEEILSSF